MAGSPNPAEVWAVTCLGSEGGREGGKEGWRKGGVEKCSLTISHLSLSLSPLSLSSLSLSLSFSHFTHPSQNEEMDREREGGGGGGLCAQNRHTHYITHLRVSLTFI